MITVTLSGATRAELLANINNIQSILGGDTAVESKKTKVAEIAEEETFDLDAATDGEEAEEPTISIDDVRSSLLAYAKAKPGNREKALKILAKYKAKDLKSLNADHYPAVMKALGA